MNKSIFLALITLFFVFTSTNAELLSQPSNDIYEPPETYSTIEPYLLNMNAEVFASAGSCSTDDYSGCTLKDVINDIDRTDDFKPEVRINFTNSDFFTTDINATLRQRGGLSSRLAPLKSFRIKLNKKTPLWNGQRRIQLVKDYDDLSRIRNKLSFDFFTEIPHLPSLETRFVNFTIKDGKKIKLGLYTHLEHVGKEYLKRRNWNKKSALYKAEYFQFINSPDLAVNSEGKPINKKNFEKLLEIKTGKNHKPLQDMLHALENEALDFNTEILDIYFDKDNLLTWLAVNILMNNIDTKVHNYYLYNPYNSKKFYFIPWDYDRAWGLAQEQDKTVVNKLPNWWFTHANWNENKLFNRFFQNSNNIELLRQVITEIKQQYLTPEKIQRKVGLYQNSIFPLLREKADWNTIQLKGSTDSERITEYHRIMQLFSKNVEFNYHMFLQHFRDPMPFRLNSPKVDPINNEISFSWTRSASLFNQSIIYDLEIANNKTFTKGSILNHINNIQSTNHRLHWKHPKGRYYFRVIAKDANSPLKYWQLAWNRTIKLENGLQAYGVKSFIVTNIDNTTYKNGNISWYLLLILFLLAITRYKYISVVKNVKKAGGG